MAKKNSTGGFSEIAAEPPLQPSKESDFIDLFPIGFGDIYEVLFEMEGKKIGQRINDLIRDIFNNEDAVRILFGLNRAKRREVYCEIGMIILSWLPQDFPCAFGASSESEKSKIYRDFITPEFEKLHDVLDELAEKILHEDSASRWLQSGIIQMTTIASTLKWRLLIRKELSKTASFRFVRGYLNLKRHLNDKSCRKLIKITFERMRVSEVPMDINSKNWTNHLKPSKLNELVKNNHFDFLRVKNSARGFDAVWRYLPKLHQ